MKHPFKLRKVVKEINAPTDYNPNRFVTYELLECGHYKAQKEIESSAEAIRFMIKLVNNEPIKRRCYECTTGNKSIPRINDEWVKKQ
jgi:hypothetical protein